MCQCPSKTEDQCSQAMKQAAEKVFENNMHHYHESPSSPCIDNMHDANLPEERVQILPSEKELSALGEDSSNIFKKLNIDRNMERRNATFCNGKYNVLNDFCYAEFLAYYTLENKSNKISEYQPDELNDNLIENNHEECSYPKKIKLIISGDKIRCRKVRRILRYHVPNKILSPEKFAHHVLLLFYPFRDEKELSSGFPPFYQNKLQEEGK